MDRTFYVTAFEENYIYEGIIVCLPLYSYEYRTSNIKTGLFNVLNSPLSNLTNFLNYFKNNNLKLL